ncbi:MAG: hypothetical protein MZV63_52675 [Marinilabiliales bacterium]|nr:hypothetical protein [Marinilabiliales bacterium]
MKNKIIIVAAALIALNLSCSKDPGTDEKAYPTDGLISYFPFDDNLADELINTPAGVNHNSAAFTEGKAGKAYIA